MKFLLILVKKCRLKQDPWLAVCLFLPVFILASNSVVNIWLDCGWQHKSMSSDLRTRFIQTTCSFVSKALDPLEM